MKDLHLPVPIVSIEWLKEHLDHPDLIVLDATIPKVGQAAPDPTAAVLAIPGARFFDLKNVFRDQNNPLPNTMPEPGQFSLAAQKLGVSNHSRIVVYDRHDIYSSPRAWWIFRTMGHPRVSVLDGGLPAWQAAGLAIEKLKKYTGPEGDFEAHYEDHLLVDSQIVLQSINDPGKLILDARSEGRFLAIQPEPRVDLRGGHIPGSKSLPHTEVTSGGKMKTVEELKALFAAKGAGNQQLLFSCGSGITACKIALAAEVAGFFDKSVYDGSWTDWAGNLSLPVEK